MSSEIIKFKVLVQLAVDYYSGNNSHFSFSKDVSASFVDKALDVVGLTLPDSMHLSSKIEWLRAFN